MTVEMEAELQQMLEPHFRKNVGWGYNWTQEIQLPNDCYANVCCYKLATDPQERVSFAVNLHLPGIRSFTDPPVAEYIFANQDRLKEVQAAGVDPLRTEQLWSRKPVSRTSIDDLCAATQRKLKIVDFHRTLAGELTFYFMDFRNEPRISLARTYNGSDFGFGKHHHLVIGIGPDEKPLTKETLALASYLVGANKTADCILTK